MADPEREPPRLAITPAQVAGSALAAVSGAVFASWAGTTGTIIGAALGSVIATVGSATYTWSLRRTNAVVRERARRAALRTNALPRTVSEGPMRDPAEPVTEVEEPEQTRFPWGRVAVAAAVVLALALAGITVFEAFTGKPVSTLVGKDSGKGTTLGHVVGSDPKPSPTPTPRSPSEPSTSTDGSSSPPPGEAPTPSSSTPSPTAPTGSETSTDSATPAP